MFVSSSVFTASQGSKWPFHFYCKVLIHNAAAPIGPFALSVDNFEIQMATDYIGPFLFTKLIAPKILATKTAGYTPRMVIVASDAHKLPNTHGVDLEFLQKPEASKCETSNLFQQAKSANIMFALEVTKRAKGGFNAYSVHPGSTV
jgi:NAD(P)-dependent dehydrogenase (short-subunit alcohol dehydrogenase family)